MLNYNPSALTDNKTLLEKLNEILLYLKENPVYKIYQTTDMYSISTGEYNINNVYVKEGQTIGENDLILFTNAFVGTVFEVTETTYKIKTAVNIKGTTGATGPQGETGPQGNDGLSVFLVNSYIDAETTEVLKSDILLPTGRKLQINDILISSYADTQGAYVVVSTINDAIVNVDYIGKFGGGEVPTSLPATGAKITGNLPTSGWNTDTPFYNGNVAIAYSSSGNYGTKICSGDFTAAKNITATIKYGSTSSEERTEKTESFTLTTGNRSFSMSVGLGTANNAYFLIKSDGIYAYKSSQGTEVIALKFTSPEIAGATVNYTISDTAIKANSTVSMYLNSADEVRAYSKADGSVVVEMDSVPTVAIPYTLQVVETSAEGAFEIINSYVPTIPETPTALPQEAGALKSGNLPTSGWNADYSADVFKGTYTNDGKYPNTFYEIPNATAPENKNKLYVTFSNNSTVEMAGSYYSDLPGWQYNSSSTPNGYSVYIRIKTNGQVLGALRGNTIIRIATYPISDGTIYNYTISDTDITANSDILMELTDEGGVKAYSMEAGSITVIRDAVPTNPIPYTYKVKQTNASGQFTVLNHFVGVTSVNGQTGAVTIAVPTTTTLYEDSTGAATVTLSETINNGDIVRIKTNNGNVDHYYIGVAWNRAITVTESLMVTDESDVTVGTAINIDSLRFNIQDTSLILFHYFNTNITTTGAVTISNEKANVVIRKVERMHA